MALAQGMAFRWACPELVLSLSKGEVEGIYPAGTRPPPNFRGEGNADYLLPLDGDLFIMAP